MNNNKTTANMDQSHQLTEHAEGDGVSHSLPNVVGGLTRVNHIVLLVRQRHADRRPGHEAP